MSDKVKYLVVMEPNMVKGVSLIRLTFDPLHTLYDSANAQGVFTPIDETDFLRLPHHRMVEVMDTFLEEWSKGEAVGYETIANYVV